MVDLAAKGTLYCCRTIPSVRGQFPWEFTKATLERRESLFLSKDNLMAVHWKDKRDVYVVSTIHGNEIKDVQRHGEDVPIKKPKSI